jgi:hypothetical protein
MHSVLSGFSSQRAASPSAGDHWPERGLGNAGSV